VYLIFHLKKVFKFSVNDGAQVDC